MNKINIDDILEKHGGQEYYEGRVYGDFAYPYKTVHAAIKEIVEAVIDRCAEEAKTSWVHQGIDKNSITNVKTMIDYEN